MRVTLYALRQMQEIVRYISATLQSPENAIRWLDTIFSYCENKKMRDETAVKQFILSEILYFHVLFTLSWAMEATSST